MTLPTPEPPKPLGLPIGSVRALLVLILLATVAIIALALIARVLTSSGPEADSTVKELALVVIGAIVGSFSTAVAFYFTVRNAGATE